LSRWWYYSWLWGGKKIFADYLFKIQKKGFILDIVPISKRKQDYTQEATSVAYISDFIDPSIETSSHRYENNLGLNYSPAALIKQHFMARFENESKKRLLEEIQENRDLKSDIKDHCYGSGNIESEWKRSKSNM